MEESPKVAEPSGAAYQPRVEKKLNLPANLFWEYDLKNFDCDKSYFIVIERIIERGTVEQWRMMQQYYGKEKVLEVAEKSKQLSQRDRQFARLFVNSSLHAVSR